MLGQGPREMVAGQRDRPLPNDAAAVGDDEVRAIGPDVQRDNALLLAVSLSRSRVGLLGFGLTKQIVGDEVAQSQRRHLDEVHFNVDFLEVLEIAVDHVALHGEQAYFRLHREAVGYGAGSDLLIIPDDLVQIERNLLLRFKANDVADLLFLDRGQLDEARQAALAGHADGHLVAAQRIAGQELFQRLPGKLVGSGVRLTQDFGMFDIVKGGGDDFAFLTNLHPQGLEGALAQIDPPDAKGFGRHDDLHSRSRKDRKQDCLTQPPYEKRLKAGVQGIFGETLLH